MFSKPKIRVLREWVRIWGRELGMDHYQGKSGGEFLNILKNKNKQICLSAGYVNSLTFWFCIPRIWLSKLLLNELIKNNGESKFSYFFTSWIEHSWFFSSPSSSFFFCFFFSTCSLPATLSPAFPSLCTECAKLLLSETSSFMLGF